MIVARLLKKNNQGVGTAETQKPVGNFVASAVQACFRTCVQIVKRLTNLGCFAANVDIDFQTLSPKRPTLGCERPSVRIATLKCR